MAYETALSKRVRRWLDAAQCRGSFDVAGSLVGLSADTIADEMAREWDSGDRDSTHEATDVEPFVQRWLDKNT